jgi:adenylate cyclase
MDHAHLPPAATPGSWQSKFGRKKLAGSSLVNPPTDAEQANLLALVDIGQVVNSSLELDEVLRIVMDTIVRLTGAERGFLMLYNEMGELVMRIARNWEHESINSSEYAISRTIVNRVVTQGNAVLTTNALVDPRFGNQQSIILQGLRSILCAPLKVKGTLIGVIYADNRIRSGIFTERERNMLAAFANQAAVAIENARLFESVKKTLAEVTALKGLMDNVFASIASGVITVDNQNRITLCNQAAQAILAHSGLNLVGQCLPDAVPSIAGDLFQKVNYVRLSGQNVVGLEYEGSMPGRGPVALSLDISPLKGAAQNTGDVVIVVDDLTEKKHLEAQRRLFERMVSPAVIDQLDPNVLHLGGKRAEITALFVDIHGFTNLSEQLAPEKLVSVLNRYLAAFAEAVLAQEGTIDKFMGDSLMAWFNAPIPQPDHALRAVRAALGIRTTVQKLQNLLPPEYRLSIGAGIHYGEAVLGLVGTEKRLEYTAIGDSVNTAKRIQENAAPWQLLISASAFHFLAGKVSVRLAQPLILKGKQQPVEVYEIIGMV